MLTDHALSKNMLQHVDRLQVGDSRLVIWKQVNVDGAEASAAELVDRSENKLAKHIANVFSLHVDRAAESVDLVIWGDAVFIEDGGEHHLCNHAPLLIGWRGLEEICKGRQSLQAFGKITTTLLAAQRRVLLAGRILVVRLQLQLLLLTLLLQQPVKHCKHLGKMVQLAAKTFVALEDCSHNVFVIDLVFRTLLFRFLPCVVIVVAESEVDFPHADFLVSFIFSRCVHVNT